MEEIHRQDPGLHGWVFVLQDSQEFSFWADIIKADVIHLAIICSSAVKDKNFFILNLFSFLKTCFHLIIMNDWVQSENVNPFKSTTQYSLEPVKGSEYLLNLTVD